MTTDPCIPQRLYHAERAMLDCGAGEDFGTTQKAYHDAVMDAAKHYPEASTALLLSAYSKISHPALKQNFVGALLASVSEQEPEEAVTLLVHMGMGIAVCPGPFMNRYLAAIMRESKRLFTQKPDKAGPFMEELLQSDLPFAHSRVREKWAMAVVCACRHANQKEPAAHARLDRWAHKLLNLNDSRASLLQKLLP